MAQYYEYADGSWWYIDDDGFETSGDAMGNVEYQDPSSGGISVDQISDVITAAAEAIRAARGYPVQSPLPRYSGAAPPPGSIAANLNKSGGSISLSTNTILLIGAGVMLFILGQKRGR